MKRVVCLIALSLAVLVPTPAFCQHAEHAGALSFASDFQTVPVMANVPGIGGTFQSYVALFNPTASSFSVTASLYDAAGVKRDAMITLAAGQLKTYTNFLDAVFNYSGGGAVTFQSPESTGGTHNNRFIVSTEVRTSGTRYSTTIPVLEFAGSNSPSFGAGITVDANTRTNVGCFNQSSAPNPVKVTIFDNTGTQMVGSANLVLAANAWGQAPVNAIVSGGYVRFEPAEAAVCYAVIVDNSTNDGRFISAAEYRP
jgi:hypothetical protein